MYEEYSLKGNLTSHRTSLTNVQNGLRLEEGTGKGDKHGSRRENRNSQAAVILILEIDGMSTPPLYNTSDKLITAPVMITHLARNTEGPNSGGSSPYFTTTASPADNVNICRLCLPHSHRASTCSQLHEATNLTIDHRHLSFTILSPRNSVRPGKCDPRASCGIKPNQFRPKSCIPWGSDKNTPSARKSATVARAAFPLARSRSIQPKS